MAGIKTIRVEQSELDQDIATFKKASQLISVDDQELKITAGDLQRQVKVACGERSGEIKNKSKVEI